MSQRQWHGPLVPSPGLRALAGGKSRSSSPSPLPGLSMATAAHEAERPPGGTGACTPHRGRWHLQAPKPWEAGKGGLFCQGRFQVQGGLGILNQDPLVDSRASDYRPRYLLAQPLDLLARPPAQLRNGARTHCPALLSGPKRTQGRVTEAEAAPCWGNPPRLPRISRLRPVQSHRRRSMSARAGVFSEWFTANAFLCHQGLLLCGHRWQRGRGSLGSMAGRVRRNDSLSLEHLGVHWEGSSHDHPCHVPPCLYVLSL